MIDQALKRMAIPGKKIDGKDWSADGLCSQQALFHILAVMRRQCHGDAHPYKWLSE
jgi:hypothetical protein